MKKYLGGVIIGIIITIVPIVFFFGNALKYSMFYDFVVNKYDGEVDAQKMEESIYAGIVNGLGDKHSQYISSDYLDDFEQSLSTSYEGIGVMIQVSESEPYVTVTQVLDGGAASTENIRVGDQILAVNDEKITKDNAKNVSDLIKSKPEVNLDLYRPSTDEKINIKTKGKAFTSPSVHASVITQGEQKNGLIKIDSFSSTTGEEFTQSLAEIESKGIDKLVIDLRDNPGGELSQLEIVADAIVPGERPYLITKKDGKVVKEYSSTLKEAKDYPIAVLQNQNTASAAEILSAALKEINGSEIYGSQSYGKGSVQQVFNTPVSDAAMKVTIEHWYSPDENKIDGIGVAPTVEMKDDKINVMPIILQKDLKAGDQGNQIIQLKTYLKMIGYDVDPENSIFDAKTTSAVKDIQTKANLEVNGIVDLDTADIIYEKADDVRYHPKNDTMIKKTFE